MNCTACIRIANSNRHHRHSCFLEWCDRLNWLQHHNAGICNRLAEESLIVWHAILMLTHCLSMNCSSVMVFPLMKQPRIAWRFVSVSHIRNWSIYLPEWVKVTIVLGLHLSQSIMTAIARNVWPTTFLCDYLIETLKFFVADNPWMCI